MGAPVHLQLVDNGQHTPFRHVYPVVQVVDMHMPTDRRLLAHTCKVDASIGGAIVSKCIPGTRWGTVNRSTPPLHVMGYKYPDTQALRVITGLRTGGWYNAGNNNNVTFHLLCACVVAVTTIAIINNSRMIIIGCLCLFVSSRIV